MTQLVRMRALVLSVPLAGLAASPEPVPTTFVYKTAGTLAIKADVYRPEKAPAHSPVVVYMHGGSLINGKRESVQRWAPLEDFLHAGVIVVSIDYRLAPETKLPAIIEDMEDAFRWVREKGPALFGVDPERIAVAGTSAGGYLALAAGYRIKPRPKVVYAEMSYADLIGGWQMRPSIHPPHYHDSHLNEAEAWQQVSGPPIANGEDRHGDGSAFNDFIRRSARWPKAISGWDPVSEADKFLPYLPLRNVTAAYPPTIMLHGAIDSDVIPQQPLAMDSELERHGIEHKLIFLPNGEHGFRGADPADIKAAQNEAVAFVLDRLRPYRKAAALPAVETFTYKRVGNLEIKADVVRGRSDGQPAPVAVWIHGGGLMSGERQRDSVHERRVADLLAAEGITVVAIDYRLAPETKLPGIVSDIEDALRWVRTDGPRLFGADPAHVAALGSSAGGFLTLVAGARVQPRLAALVSFWGYGDITSAWAVTPSTAPRHNKIKATRAEAEACIAPSPVANAADRAQPIGPYYQYCRRHGLWSQAISGWDAHTEAGKFASYMPVQNLSPDFPPTLLIHGTGDTDVPVGQSEALTAGLAREGVEHRFIRVPGGEHGLKNCDEETIDAMDRAAADFLRQHLLPSATTTHTGNAQLPQAGAPTVQSGAPALRAG
ncbi:MAG TPA: alpha/beta hydrolase [Lacunisphaera sp.]|nr:alpha/beta hydrolase [Lacunisphaera sp.]